jgi:glycosyltransferase involved in cell wall biosynthesis
LSSTLNKVETCAVIPFYNKEKTIKEIIEKTLQHVNCVIALDDGSIDDSVKKITKDGKIILLQNNNNRGKGYSLSLGFRKSIELNSEYTVTLDADIQHPPDLIQNFLEKLHDDDIIIGNRLESFEDMPLHRILINKLTSFLLSLKTKRKIEDSQCGFRVYRTKILSNIIPKFYGFEAESEIIINAIRKNYKTDYFNIPTIYEEEKSKMKSVQTITRFIKVLFI